jgi:PAS domain S-box-containing protein
MALRSVEHYGQFLDTLPDAALLVNQRGTIVFANAHTTALLGYAPNDLIGRPVKVLAWEGDSDSTQLTGAALSCQASTRLGLRARHRDGRDLWLDLTLSPHKLGPTPLTLFMLRDLRWQQQQFQTLTALGTALREAQSRGAVLRTLLDQLLRLVPASGAAFAGRELDEVVVEQGAGLLEPWTNLRVSASELGSSRLMNQTPFVTAAPGEHPWHARRHLPSEVKGYASIPMQTHGNVLGALVVTKAEPFVTQEVDTLVAVGEIAAIALQRAAMHERLLHESAAIEEAYEATVESWGRALDMRDRVAEGHTRRVTDLTLRLARRMGVNEDRLPHVRRGAMLHDIGNMVVPDSILFKPGRLTDDERAIMRRHTEHAYDLLGSIEFLRPALEIPSFHHERWDGSGYPRGLKGHDIPLAARIFAVADAYDAITSDRPYSRAESPEAALGAIAARSGTQFDPEVVQALLELSSSLMGRQISQPPDQKEP